MHAENVIIPDFSIQEVKNPLYRVLFWEKIRGVWAHDVWLLTDCTSVFEALAWIQENQGERLFELFVSTKHDTESEEIAQLFGENPTRDKEPTTAQVIMTKETE